MINIKNSNPENHSKFLREIKEDLMKWKDILCSQVSRFKIAYDVNSPQIDLQIQYNCYKNISGLF